MAFMALVLRALPPAREGKVPTPRREVEQPHRSLPERIADFFRIETNVVSTYATILTVAINQFAAILFAIIHGVWFADQYGFGPRELGYVALIFGCFDLAGSVSVSLFTDRFGKRRSVILGTTGAMIGYLLIPWLNVAVVPAVLSAALARGFFEFAIVANLPLLSGQSPNQRAKVMTLSAAFGLGTATIASFVAPMLYTQVGITGIATISAIFSAIALFLLLTWVREGPEAHPSHVG
jgi:predicted MFS family arabinose efflux permease